ncbi:MAG: hypothetical protein FD174_1277 [Geobacteraceae bacterium]|nr:MAG: hypothetical protein FD174_1277 [Geobacteraceae bacterium]
MKNVTHITKYVLIYAVLVAISLQSALPFMKLLERYLWEDLALTVSCLAGVIVFGTMDILMNTYGKRAYARLQKIGAHR